MSVEPKAIVISGGGLIDGTGSRPIERAEIMIEKDRILRISPTGMMDLPPDCTRINASGTTILPGLIDLHVHLTHNSDPRGWAATWEQSAPRLALQACSNAKRTLEMGFTTLRDAGDICFVAVAVRDAIAEGLVTGPRVLSAGQYLATTGGHGDYMPPWLNRLDDDANLADGIEGVIKAVRRQVRNRVDWIKFVATGDLNDPTSRPQFNSQEMRVLVKEAHLKGRKVSAHCLDAESALAAVKAGVDTIEHGVDLSDEVVSLMRSRGTVLVPTLTVSHLSARLGEKDGVPRRKLAVYPMLLARHLEAFQRALQAGVRIALGTDAGYMPVFHGTNALELRLLVEQGLKPIEAIEIATLRSAEVIGLADRIGSLMPGKMADLIIVKGNPLNDITLLEKMENILLVMKEGRVLVDRLKQQGNN